VNDVKRIHLIGICGTGMRSLAVWYRESGFEVSGCDTYPGKCSKLSELGIEVFEGNSAEHINSCDLIVFTAAVPTDHPELLEAARRGIPILRRSEALAELTKDMQLYAISGAHGKTTTTAMLGWILQKTGLDPTVMVGGHVEPWGGNYRSGGEIAVVEADEFDRAFLRLSPLCAAVTTFAREHLECYGSPEALSIAFGVFLEMTRPGGTVVVPVNLIELAKWAERIGRRIITTGKSGDFYCSSRGHSGWEQEFELKGIRGTLPIPGAYNLRNAETAIAMASVAGVDIEEAIAVLADFPGVKRRLEKIGSFGEAILLSDYAHHPDEMKAALTGLRNTLDCRIGVVFQPRLFTRPAAHSEEMGKALSGADWSIVLPVYAIREKPIPGIDSSLIVDAALRSGGDCILCEMDDVEEELRKREADVIVFMSSGTVDALGRGIAGR